MSHDEALLESACNNIVEVGAWYCARCVSEWTVRVGE